MAKGPDFDVSAAHHFFSGSCFNQAWNLIEKFDRTPGETDDMLQIAHASAWRWRQRPDCTKDKLSISFWQLSRVYALARESPRASRYAQLCLDASQGEAPFLIAYAYEALARAAAIGGQRAVAEGHLKRAKEFVSQVEDEEERQLVQKDIESIQW